MFTSLQLGNAVVSLEHRVVLAPLTRNRAAEPTLTPQAMNVEYYSQRASKGGLLITEATNITPESIAYPGVPGIWTDEQTAQWRKVTEAVHAKGGVIFMQLWHTGRCGAVENRSFAKHPMVSDRTNRSKVVPGVSSSAEAIHYSRKGVRKVGKTMTYNGLSRYAVPRALETSEIPRLLDDYRHAACNAKAAGFDGVEVHAAHGYLIDQFLSDSTNRRTDRYGGSVENRCRLLFEVVGAVCEVFGKGRVAVRLSPTKKGTIEYFGNGIASAGTYEHAVRGLNKFGLAYLLLTEPRWFSKFDGDHSSDPGFSMPTFNDSFRELYHGVLMGAGGFTPKSAAKALADGIYDLVAFGRWFISNPDLPYRLQQGLPLNVYNRKFFYSQESRGYTDYPTYADAEKLGVDMVAQDDIGASLSATRKAQARRRRVATSKL